MSSVAADDVTRLRAMISGYMLSQVISVTASLGLADALGTRTVAGEALAEATKTHERSLLRLLRALIAWGLLKEPEVGRFRLTALGALLRSDAPGSLHSLAMVGEATWRAWGELLHAVRTGENAFEHIFGMGSFQYSALHPERAALFDAYMADRTQRSAAAILVAHDFSRYRHIVDVGGGNAILLSAILAAVPQARGIVFDTAVGVEGARRRLEQAGVTNRCRVLAGDFFESGQLPKGADAYILKSILHDWNDERAIAILANCRRAMRPDSKLLVVERLLPERTEYCDAHREIVMMDLHMLAVPGGRERTGGQYADLFAAAGLTSPELRPTRSPFVTMEVRQEGEHA
jgi:hypothetical protein